jgi:chemosensory pili system protein ChpA (sensor histidine kinase/response regulator)
MSGDLDTSAIRAFADELSSSLAEIDRALGTVESDPAERHPAREAYRLFHALKGAASMVGLAAFSYLLNQAEEILEPESEDVAVDPGVVRRLHAVVPKLSDYLEAGLTGAPCLPIARELSRMLQAAAGNPPVDDAVIADLVAVDVRELAASVPPAVSQASAEAAAVDPIRLPEAPGAAPVAGRSLGEVATIHARPPAPAPADDLDLGSTDEIPPELAEVFAQEAQEHLQAIARYTSELGQTPPDRDSLQELRRAVHTLKGAAGVVGYTAASRLAHRMEDLLDSLYEGGAVLTPDAVTVLKSSSDGLGDLLSGQLPPGTQRTLLQRLRGAFDALQPAAAAPAARTAGAAVEPPRGPSVHFESAQPAGAAAAAPGAGKAPAERRQGPAERREGIEDRRGHSQLVRIPLGRLNELVRLMTELIVNRATFEQHHAGLIEAVDELKLSTARLRRVTQKLETNYEARALGGNLLARSARGSDGGPSSQYGFDELEFDRYTDFHLLTRELAETVSDIATIGARVGDTIGDFDSDLTRLGRVTRDIQDKVMEFRMVPLMTITSRLERAVRVTAEACGKSVVFDVEGAQVAIDKQLLQEMSDPLMHLLRNAVDHGIEAPEVREAAGKPREGRIVVRAYHEGTDVILEVQDDGKGLDLERIRRTVVERGYVSEAEAATLDAEALTAYVFEPGFSTATQVTEISGRGVGLDIVKAKVVRLNGRIAVTSRPSAGAIVIMRVPMTLAITRILLFRAGNEVLGLPLGAVTQIVRPAAGAIVPLSLDRVVTIGGTTYPVRDLSEVLGLPRPAEPAQVQRPLLVANLSGRYVALEIDEVLGSRDAVVKTLGTHLRRVPGVWGATLLGDGTVVLILNPADLTAAASEKPRPRRVAPRAVAVEREPYTILIVDDSLSMRHVLSAAVRRAGWNPVQARDGLEALEAVHRRPRPPDLILLDIEMPRMDGYEFLATMRGQKAYASLPIVMLTSRGGEKHREKAQSLGATDYLVKPFHEDALIDTVGRLIQASRRPERKAAS